MPLGTDVCLGPGDIVLDGNPVTTPPSYPQFSARVYFGKPIAISATAEYLSYNFGHFSCKTASSLTKITETPQRRRIDAFSVSV